MKSIGIVASESGPNGDILYVAQGRGDYAVGMFHGKKPPTCLVCLSTQCGHVQAVVAHLRGK